MHGAMSENVSTIVTTAGLFQIRGPRFEEDKVSALRALHVGGGSAWQWAQENALLSQ